MVVFPDLSNVNDEATSYFCFDDVPQYKSLCQAKSSQSETRSDDCGDNRDSNLWDDLERNFAVNDRVRTVGRYLQQNFAVSDSLRMLIKFKLQVWSGELKRGQLTPSWRIGWSVPNYDVGDTYAPLGVDGGIERTLVHMQALADLLAQHHIALTVAVYPWPLSLAQKDPGGRWVAMWRKFCVTNCKTFIDTFPDFVAAQRRPSHRLVRTIFRVGRCAFLRRRPQDRFRSPDEGWTMTARVQPAPRLPKITRRS